MVRTPGSNGARTADAIRQAALVLVYERGFEGFGLRELAQLVGLRAASLYNHISSKQELLFEIISDHMTGLISRTETVLGQCRGGPLERLAAFTANHIDCHIDRKMQVYVANFELRALNPANRELILEQRRSYEALLIGILDEGRAAGLIGTTDTHVAAYAMLAMLTGACTWYRPEGRLSKAEMIALHTELVFKGCAGTARTPRAERCAEDVRTRS